MLNVFYFARLEFIYVTRQKCLHMWIDWWWGSSIFCEVVVSVESSKGGGGSVVVETGVEEDNVNKTDKNIFTRVSHIRK